MCLTFHFWCKTFFSLKLTPKSFLTVLHRTLINMGPRTRFVIQTTGLLCGVSFCSTLDFCYPWLYTTWPSMHVLEIYLDLSQRLTLSNDISFLSYILEACIVLIAGHIVLILHVSLTLLVLPCEWQQSTVADKYSIVAAPFGSIQRVVMSLSHDKTKVRTLWCTVWL